MPANFMAQLEYFSSIIPLTYVALFHVINPIGSGVLFYNITPGADGKERRLMARNRSGSASREIGQLER